MNPNVSTTTIDLIKKPLYNTRMQHEKELEDKIRSIYAMSNLLDGAYSQLRKASSWFQRRSQNITEPMTPAEKRSVERWVLRNSNHCREGMNAAVAGDVSKLSSLRRTFELESNSYTPKIVLDDVLSMIRTCREAINSLVQHHRAVSIALFDAQPKGGTILTLEDGVAASFHVRKCSYVALCTSGNIIYWKFHAHKEADKALHAVYETANLIHSSLAHTGS